MWRKHVLRIEIREKKISMILTLLSAHLSLHVQLNSTIKDVACRIFDAQLSQTKDHGLLVGFKKTPDEKVQVFRKMYTIEVKVDLTLLKLNLCC